jgi:hypothetical protein
MPLHAAAIIERRRAPKPLLTTTNNLPAKPNIE